MFFFDFYYKPLLFSTYSILYLIGNGTPFPFHFFQISLHIINCCLLFYLFKHFIKQKYAFALALIFLVHPANKEAVVYIDALQEVLFFFFGISALLLLIYKPFKELNVISIVSLFLFFSLLSKKTGILFVGVSFLYVVFFERRSFVRISIFFSFLLILYATMRFISSDLYIFQIIRSEVMRMSFPQRLSIMPNIVTFYFKEIFIPSEVVVFGAKTIEKIEMVPFFIISFITILNIKSSWRKKDFYPVLFFLTFFLVGIIMHLQIFPLDILVAHRWLYFPLAGFLGFIGVFINRISLNRIMKYFLFFLFLILIGFYSQQTFRMNVL